MILKVKDELINIYLEYDKRGNIDIRACKVAETSLNTYNIGFFAKDTGVLHLIETIGGSGLPVDNKYNRIKTN